MATNADKVITVLELRDGDFNARVRANEQQFTRSKEREARAAEQSERRIRAASGSIGTAIMASASALAAGFTVGAVTRLADGYTRFTNQLKLAGLEGRELAMVQDQLFASAQKYGVELEGLGSLYGRVAQAGKELGATNEDLLKFTNGVAAAIKVQGASAGQVQGALLQLSQALGGVKVRAEEYNSINEGARPILQAVANGSDRFKGSVNALRNAVIDGTVTSREFYESFLKGSAQLEDQATRANLTIGASLTILNNALGRYIGQTDQSLSATQRISAAIQALANNLETIIPVLGALIGLIGVRYVAGALAAAGATMAQGYASLLAAQNARAHAAAVAIQTAANARLTASGGAATAALRFQAATTLTATTAARGFGAGLVSLAGGPIGIAILAVAGLAAGIVYLSMRAGVSEQTTRELGASATRTSTALDAYRDAAEKAAVATGKNASEARKNAEAMRIEALQAIRSARALAQRTAQLARQRAEESQQADVNASRGIGNPYAPGYEQGMADVRSRNAQAAATRAATDLARAEAELKQLEDDIKSGAIGNGGNIPPAPVEEPKTRRGRADEGLTEEEKAELREQLALEQQISVARAAGNEEAERTAQRRLDVLALTEQYERAGIENAAARAQADIDARSAAEDANREVDRLLAQSEKRQEARIALREREEAALDRQLETQIALARIEGNEELVRLLERELRLRQAIAALGPNATPEEIQTVRDDQRVIGNAEEEARVKEGYREYARVFVDAIKDADDLGDFFENLGVGLADKLSDRFAERLEKDIADLLQLIFEQVMGSVKGGGGGGGGDWAALIAQGVKAVFGGGRSLGGPVMAGQTVRVNEGTPNSEYFTPSVAGYITPSSNGSARQQRSGGMAFTYAPSIDARGAGPREVDEIKAQMARDQRTFAQRVRGVVNQGLATDRIAPPPWKS